MSERRHLRAGHSRLDYTTGLVLILKPARGTLVRTRAISGPEDRVKDREQSSKFLSWCSESEE